MHIAKRVLDTADRLANNTLVSKTIYDSKSKKAIRALGIAQSAFWTYRLIQEIRDSYEYSITVPVEVGTHYLGAIVSYVDNNRVAVADSAQHIGLTVLGQEAYTVPSEEEPIKFTHAGFTYSYQWRSRDMSKQLGSNSGMDLSRLFEMRDNTSSSFSRSDRVVITCHSRKALDAIETFLYDVLSAPPRSDKPRKSSVYTKNSWNEFSRHSHLRQRNLDSVVLHAGQIERIVEHIKRFEANEDKYIDLGIPYKTGILLHGEPGTGKSSSVVALANHFCMDLYMISLSSVKTSEDLTSLFSQIPPSSILLLEDIDLATDATTGDGSTSDGVTSSDLLNILDGVMSPHGLITVMTTNNYDNLLPALKRPGRVDLSEYITYLDSYQLERLILRFTGVDISGKYSFGADKMITPAQIVGILKDNLDNLDSIVGPLDEYLTNIL